MIVVCSMETSTTIHWSPNAVSLSRFAEGRWFGCNGHANRDQHPRQQWIFSNLFACLLNPLTPHSATQWGEECSGVNAVLLVSVLQTGSSRMFVLNQDKWHVYTLIWFCFLTFQLCTCISMILFFCLNAWKRCLGYIMTPCNIQYSMNSRFTIQAYIFNEILEKIKYPSSSLILYKVSTECKDKIAVNQVKNLKMIPL